MQRLRTVTSVDVSAVAGYHAMPAALLFGEGKHQSYNQRNTVKVRNVRAHYVNTDQTDELF